MAVLAVPVALALHESKNGIPFCRLNLSEFWPYHLERPSYSPDNEYKNN